jgi:hypothetical protein
MLADLPIYVYITFFAALLYVLVMCYFASNRNKKLVAVVVLIGMVHSLLGMLGFYEDTGTVPPRLMLLMFPLVVISMATIFSKKMKAWLRSLNLKHLTYLHAVRAPVELVLFWLFTAGYVPELMTFEGRNFDVFAGITAPMVAFIGFRGGKVNRPLLYGWHVISLILLGNVLVNASLAVPTVFQQFAFDQPNIAVLKFPFFLLPGIIVILVFLSNIAGFIILNNTKRSLHFTS